MLITVEGIDGCGKSTQARHLAEALIQMNHTVCLTKNPGDTTLGHDLRRILLHQSHPIHPRSELLLYMADRTQHWFDVILPTLQKGHIVICDRFVDSTLAYQGYGRGESLEWILELNQKALVNPSRDFWPELTFWFDADPAICLQRAKSRSGAPDRLEQENIEFYQKVRDGFMSLFKAYPERLHHLDATQPVEVLHQQVLAIVMSSLQSKL